MTGDSDPGNPHDGLLFGAYRPWVIAWSKVELDLTQLDEAGLRGPPDGKVAVAYEFAIPDTATHRAEIAAIDPTVQFMGGSRGRIGAGEGQCLCIGSTHQDNYQEVLRGLAALRYVYPPPARASADPRPGLASFRAVPVLSAARPEHGCKNPTP